MIYLGHRFLSERLGLAATLAMTLFPWTQSLWALTPDQTQALVREVDERQRNSGDYAAQVLIDQVEKGMPPKPMAARVFRRDQDDKWMILFTAPNSEAGKGYLRVDKSLFLYEPPPVGKWERQTERASILGSGSRRDDFDESRLSEEYLATFVGDEKLGKFKVHRIQLIAKPDVDVATPMIELWIDQDSHNVLKRQERALPKKGTQEPGTLLRTALYPVWEKKFSKSKGSDVYFPRKIIIYDEVQKENSTTVVLDEPSLDPLEANIFTKAWLESQKR